MGIPNTLRSTVILIGSRFKEIGMWMWFTTVACLIVCKGVPPLIPTLMSVLTVFFISTSVYVYNDVIDVELDKINPFKNHRPLPTGKVNKNDAMKVVYISGLIGLLISIFINIYTFIFSLIYLILFALYSLPEIYLKNKFIIKELILSSGHVIMALIGSYGVSGSFSINSFYASILFSILTFAFIPALNDTTDIEPDKEFGLTSIAIVLTWKKRMQLLITGLLIVMTLTPLTYINFGFNVILPIFVVAGGLIFLRYMFPLMNHFDNMMALRARKIGYSYFILLNIFFIISSLNFNFFF